MGDTFELQKQRDEAIINNLSHSMVYLLRDKVPGKVENGTAVLRKQATTRSYSRIGAKRNSTLGMEALYSYIMILQFRSTLGSAQVQSYRRPGAFLPTASSILLR
jgi:hypothetical protein